MVDTLKTSQAPLRLVFCGTPQFAVPSLEALIAAGHRIELVVTQPDRPVGRKQVLTAPPVKVAALAHGLPVVQPEKIKNNAEFRGMLEAMRPDAIVVVAYGRIIPKWMLDLPRLGCINLHGSLLPKYRGAAPIQWAIANGDEVLGNTTMLLEEGLDTGPMLMKKSLVLKPEETSEDALVRLAELGAPMVVKTLAGFADGSIVPDAQDDSQATLAPILTREDGRIDFDRQSAVEIWSRWRGFQPWPGIFTSLDEKKFLLSKVRAVVLAGDGPRRPGELWTDAGKAYVGCAGGSVLELVEVQLEGKNRTSAEEFFRGYKLAEGLRLGA